MPSSTMGQSRHLLGKCWKAPYDEIYRTVRWPLITWMAPFKLGSKKHQFKQKHQVVGARHNNLKTRCHLPVGIYGRYRGLGQRQSTLVKKILYPCPPAAGGAMAKSQDSSPNWKTEFQQHQDREFIDQNPIGRSRSNRWPTSRPTMTFSATSMLPKN